MSFWYFPTTCSQFCPETFLSLEGCVIFEPFHAYSKLDNVHWKMSLTLHKKGKLKVRGLHIAFAPILFAKAAETKGAALSARTAAIQMTLAQCSLCGEANLPISVLFQSIFTDRRHVCNTCGWNLTQRLQQAAVKQRMTSVDAGGHEERTVATGMRATLMNGALRWAVTLGGSSFCVTVPIVTWH